MQVPVEPAHMKDPQKGQPRKNLMSTLLCMHILVLDTKCFFDKQSEDIFGHLKHFDWSSQDCGVDLALRLGLELDLGQGQDQRG